MAEINRVGNQPVQPNEKQIQNPADATQKIPTLPDQAGEQTTTRGNAGQPIGLPPKTALTQSGLMPEAVTGRDATQILAAERLRANGGVSATDQMLGLNQQPTMLGGLLAPPGNLEALRHLTPTMRRNILRTLLSKQRNQMRRLVAVARDDEQHQQQKDERRESEESSETSETTLTQTPTRENALAFHNQRVYQDLASTTKMLDLLDELLNMQDYTLSQIGTFAQG